MFQTIHPRDVKPGDRLLSLNGTQFTNPNDPAPGLLVEAVNRTDEFGQLMSPVHHPERAHGTLLDVWNERWMFGIHIPDYEQGGTEPSVNVLVPRNIG